MVYPTKSLILKIDAGPLGTQAAGLDGLANSIETGARTVEDTITGLDWSGRSRDAAVDRGHSEKIQQLRVSTVLDNLREAAVNGSTGLQAIIDVVRPKVIDLEKRSYSVAEDWSVTDNTDYDLDDPGLDESVISLRKALQAHRSNEAANATVTLKSSAVSFQEIDDATALSITSAIEQLGQLAPVTAGLSGDDATTITRKMEAGLALTPTELAQLDAATNLTPEQQQALADGKPATMSQGQYDFLYEMMRELDDNSPAEIDSALAALPPNQRDLVRGEIGDALRMAGNPNVTTTAGHKGGMAQLPKEIRDLLVESPINTEFKVTSEYTDPFYTDIPKLKQFDSLNNFLSKGDQGLRLGSDLDRGLLKQASEIAGVTGGDDSDDYMGTYSNRLDVEDINRTVDAMLNNASGDHQAVSDFLSGDNMGVTVTEGNHYNANSHFLDLVSHPWDEDQRGAINVLDWIGESADAPGYEGELAGRSADSVAHLLVNNHETLGGLMHEEGLPYTYTSMGEVNPHLTQAVATSMAPYLGNFVGLPDGMLVNPHAEQFGTVSELSKLFNVLDSDPTAAGVMHGASAQWENNIAYQYGLHPDMPNLPHAAGQLNQAADEGVIDQMEVLRSNHRWDEIVEYNTNSMKYDTIYGLLNAAPVPGLGEVMGVASPSVKFEMIDIPNDPAKMRDDQWVDAYDELKESSGTDSIVRSYSILDGYAEAHPEIRDQLVYDDPQTGLTKSFCLPNGRIDWDEVAKNPGQFQTIFDDLPFEKYGMHYAAGLDDNAIDPTIIPRPHDPSLPPNP